MKSIIEIIGYFTLINGDGTENKTTKCKITGTITGTGGDLFDHYGDSDIHNVSFKPEMELSFVKSYLQDKNRNPITHRLNFNPEKRWYEGTYQDGDKIGRVQCILVEVPEDFGRFA
ncbi:MAG: hypothetical protein WCV55_00600 [Candidatus Paceibacterota bacterium]